MFVGFELLGLLWTVKVTNPYLEWLDLALNDIYDIEKSMQ